MKGIFRWIGLFLLLMNVSFAADQKDQFSAAAIDAYIYAFPAVLSEVTKQVMTNVSSAGQDGRAPINQFSHASKLATPENRDVVKPNADTLYSIAWLDLSKEPLVLSVPETNNRYYLMPLLDIWTEVFNSIGKRTTGTKPGNFVIVGPAWQGELPKDMPVINALTPTVWIIGRTLLNGPDDLQAVRAIQRGYQLTPLSQWETDYLPPQNCPIDPSIDMKTPPLDQVKKMDAVTYFTLFANILKTNPPHVEDTIILKKLALIGIVPGQSFDASILTKEQIEKLNQATTHALQRIELFVPKLTKEVDGWMILDNMIGQYGTAYLKRAAVGYIGLGANIPDDAIYPNAFDSKRNRKLTGTNSYVLHFESKDIPPVNGFWSLTLYDSDNYLVENPIHRYSLGDRSPMQYNSDGSLDIYIQNESPGKNKESNWLPAPKDDFSLSLRLYWPKPQVLNGEWQPVGVQRVPLARK